MREARPRNGPGKGRRLAALGLYVSLAAFLTAFASTKAPAATSRASATTVTTAAAAASEAVAQVRMHDIAFLPQSLTVSAGTTITWTNQDDMVHTVTSGVDHDDGMWTSSPSIPPGGTFSVTLSKPGTYHYYCKPHMYSPAMHATIVVEPAGH